MIVLDTSFLVSFFLTQDVNHEKALVIALKHNKETMLLPDTILFETLTVLNYKSNIALCKEAYDELMRNKQVKLFYFTELEKEEILAQFFEYKKKLSTQDISIIYLANKTRSCVLTFDDNIKKLIK